jgi:biotin transporter BioY
MLRAIDGITGQEGRMHIAAVGWIYVVLMMAITEDSVTAGIMTFFFYGVLPTLLIVYIGGSGQRRKRRELERLQAMQERQQAGQDQPPGPT